MYFGFLGLSGRYHSDNLDVQNMGIDKDQMGNTEIYVETHKM